MIQIDHKQLGYRCNQSISDIMNDLNGEIMDCDGLCYSYKDNNSKVLAVAHCDTVLRSKVFQRVKLDNDTLIFSPNLDDRLGVYTIMDLLPSIGIKMDILLTDGEESGCTTASYFETKKRYNWVVEFDRHGDDVVTYQYDWDKKLSKCFKVGYGSYSDICELDSLGCQAVNIGIGYHGEHTASCYMSITEYLDQINKFVKFYGDNVNTRYKYIKKQYNFQNIYDTWYDDNEIILGCEDCGEIFYKNQTIKSGFYLLCPSCGNYIR